MILSKLLLWWENVKSIGAGDDQEENAILSLINQMGVLGIIAFMLVFPFLIVVEGVQLVLIVPLFFGLSVLLTLVFNYFGKAQYSKNIITIIHPCLVSVYMILSGGHFGEECIIVVTVFMIYTLYYRRPGRVLKLYFFTFLLYFGAEAFLLINGSILVVPDKPYDEAICFLLSAVWIGKIIEAYRSQLKANVDDRIQLITSLQAKNSNLEKTSAELEQFTYIASHDLKTPLRTIISFLGLMKRDISRQKFHSLLANLGFARDGANQMNLLLQDILSYSRIMGEAQKEEAEVDLNSVLDDVKFELNDFIEQKGGEVTADELPVIKGIPERYITLFKNFIRNGIQYNESSLPTVHIQAKVVGKSLVLHFEDNGIGIEEQYFKKIFLLFKRLHTHVYYKGTGLGLGLCRKIVENMGGSIHVSSTVNLGTTFTVKIPVEKVISSPLNKKKYLATAEL